VGEAFVPFWRLRRHGVAEEVVRGRALKRRAGERWTMPAAARERLRGLLEDVGLDASADIVVSESADDNGFRLTQPERPIGQNSV